MQVRIIAVGKIKERFLAEGIAEYERRLSPYLKLTVVEVADERRGVHSLAGQEQLIKDREGDRILAAIPEGAHVVALDVRGRQSVERGARRPDARLADGGDERHNDNHRGGSGLSEAVLARAALCLSISPMTFTHQMVRLILLEQIYRACRINSGEPYHK